MVQQPHPENRQEFNFSLNNLHGIWAEFQLEAMSEIYQAQITRRVAASSKAQGEI